MLIITYFKRCILFLIFIFFSGLCHGQAYKYRFRTINLPEEFKNQYISIVDEDAAGMLWFVTNNGLHRYDGNQVVTFDMQSTPALPNAEVGLLVADSRNHLWIACSGKLVCFDLKRWTIRQVPFQHDSPTLQDSRVTAITEGTDGTVYASFNNMNLFRVANDSLVFITHIDKQKGSVETGNDFITDIREPLPGQLLLTISNGKIISVRHRQHIFSPPVYCHYEPLGSQSLTLSGSAHLSYSLLMVPFKGPCLVNLKQAVVTPLTSPAGIPSLQNNPVSVAGSGDNQAMFFYKEPETVMLVYDVRRNTFEDLRNVFPATFKNNKPRGIIYKNGHILIPNKGSIGIVSYTNSALDMFTASLEGINSIRTIYKLPGGHLLIGSYLYGFIELDETSSAKKSITGQFLACLLPWRKDTLLAGMEGGGLGWYLPASKQIVPLFGADKSKPAPVDPFVICMVPESDTSLWVSTTSGLFLLNVYSKRVLNYLLPATAQWLQQSQVYDILKIGKARFFATREGLFKYDLMANSWIKLLRATNGNLENSYFTCLRLMNNQIWAGTVGNGMLVMDTAGNLIRKITTADGLAGNIIFSNPVWKNYILVGTRTGLSIMNNQSGKIINYSSSYYLPANEFNRSAWFVNGDTVYMGTINGIIRIDMKRLQMQQETVVPGICLSRFTFSGEHNNQSDYTLAYHDHVSLTIPPDASNFSIGFGAISEMAAGLKLYYRLSANGQWQEIGQRREVTFVNVAPDKYTMQIAARMPDGRWMENILTLPITVQPHFYQTWWWKGLLLAAGLGLIWLGIKYREANILKEQKLRSRIAGDLHDEVGSALTRIYFQAGSLTATNETMAQPTAALQQIASSSQEALSSMSDMVWSIDAHYDTAPEMVGRMKDYIARLQDEMDCHCTFNVSGNYERLKLSQVLRQNILLIFKEAINNALKYGSNKTVAVEFSLNESLLILAVKNKLTASGIVENAVQGGHGMKSMQLRAKKIKAQLSVNQTSDEFIVQLQAKPF